MKLLFDFFPILLFFIFFKLFGIYVATATAMTAALVQVLFFRLCYQRYEKIQVISMLIILILGGATLFFHNPWFIKWKPTGIYWLSAIVFLSSLFIGDKTIIQKMLGNSITLHSKVWRRLNTAWALFFVLMGLLNIYVAYHFDTNTWVNFKLFGGTGMTLLFVMLQAMYLSKHSALEKKLPGEI